MKHSAEFESFDNLVGKLLTVTPDEMQRREAEYRRQRDAAPTKRGPKKKAVKPPSDSPDIQD